MDLLEEELQKNGIPHLPNYRSLIEVQRSNPRRARRTQGGCHIHLKNRSASPFLVFTASPFLAQSDHSGPVTLV
jgi:hypothetical protein